MPMVPAVGFHVHKILESTKKSTVTEQTDGFRGEERERSRRRDGLWRGKRSLHLDCRNGSTGAYSVQTCQTTLSMDSVYWA